MALAALCSQIQKTPYQTLLSELQSDHAPNAAAVLRNMRFQAFVVDHGAREGSNSEARAVSKMLEERDIPTQLLKIDWAGCERPGDLPNFESLARKHRFQALGKACRNLGINSLLLAHHEDDQAETVMMRLISGHRLPGLVGMRPSSEIPECHGIHDVHESGGVDISTKDGCRKRSRAHPPVPESGGVRVYRPLLQFSKERLIATCKAERMDWFEDHTNKDPTITLRNALRHMYSSHNLPSALSKPALLNLSRKSEMKRNAMLEVTNSWLAESAVERFDTRAGTVIIRFVDLSKLEAFPFSRPQTDNRYIAALLLRRIIMLVSPEEQVNLPSLYGAVERVFPELFHSNGPQPPTTTFTVAGVQFSTP